MGADFLNIPGNIRQIYLPFSIAGAGKLQVFSFKADREGEPVAQIFPFPKTFQQLFGADSGFQYTHGPKGSEKIEYKKFLDQIPSFQIREFVPDARLTQVFKWFTYFKRAFDAATQNVDYNTFNVKGVAQQLTEAMSGLGTKMRELTSGSASLLAEIGAGFHKYYEDKGFSFGADAGYAVLWIPFVLYYRLTTTRTNTIYELPYSSTDPIIVSDGTYGWATGGQSVGIADWLGNLGGIGDFVKSGFGNTIRVNVMPSFDPTSNGGTTTGSTITVTLDLINDSDIAACNNFLFCHTLFGNNRWLQYGFVQASGSLYDVKLPGANRYFMCTGKFKCEGRGAFRSPSNTVVNYIFSCANTKSGDFDKRLEAIGRNGDNVYMEIAKAKAKSRLDVVDRQKSEAEEAAIYLPKQRSIVKSSVKRDDADDISSRQFKWTARKQLETTIKTSEGSVTVSNPYIAEYTLQTNYSQKFLDSASKYHDQSNEIRSIQKKISDKTFQASDIQRELDKAKPALKAAEDASKNFERVKKRYSPDSEEYKAAQTAMDTAKSEANNALRNADASAANVIAEQRGTTVDAIHIAFNSANDKFSNAEANTKRKFEAYHAASEDFRAKKRESEADPDNAAKRIAMEEAERRMDSANDAYQAAMSEEISARKELAIAGEAEMAVTFPDTEIDRLNSEIAEEERTLEAAKTEQDNAVEELAKDMFPEVKESLNRKVSSPSEIRDLIKIPDVYHITLEFGSLIPDNFNTYLYGFREANLDMFKNYAVGDVDETGVFDELANKLIEALGG